jgi:hypothetical protein
MDKFDKANWKQYNPKAILPGQSVVLPNEFTSRLLLVRWTRANNTPETVGEIEAIVKSPFGTPATPRQTFRVSEISDYYEFWNVANNGLPYKLSAKLQGNIRVGTQLTIWEYTPPLNTLMPFNPETDNTSTNLELTALATATAENAAAINALSGAVLGQPAAIADAIDNNDVTTLDPQVKVVGTVPVLLLAKNDNTQACLISNQGNSKIKIWAQDAPLPATTGYNSSGYIYDMTGKGSYEVVAPLYKTNIWAVGNLANGSVSVTQTVSN